jgi:hypothetical protein
VWWIIILCVAAIVCIAALIVARSRHRRGLREGLPESPDQWKVEHNATNEAARFNERPDVGGWPQSPTPF